MCNKQQVLARVSELGWCVAVHAYMRYDISSLKYARVFVPASYCSANNAFEASYTRFSAYNQNIRPQLDLALLA